MAIPPFGSPPTPDATTTKKGKVKLAGDLGGTADLPTVVQANIDHGSISGLSDDDHTQYALLAGRAGGQVLMGGTAAADTLTLRASADGLHTGNVTDGRLLFEDPITLLPTSRTFTTGTGNIISLTSELTLDVTNATTGAAYNFAPTVIYERASSAFGAGSLFLNGMTAKNASGEANNISFIYSFIHSPTITADGATITNTGSQGLRYFPVWTTANAGTLNVTASHGAYIQASNIGSGVTVTDLYGVQYNDVATLNGTLTSQAGLNVASLTKATNNTHLLMGTTTTPSGNYAIYSSVDQPSVLAGRTAVGADYTTFPVNLVVDRDLTTTTAQTIADIKVNSTTTFNTTANGNYQGLNFTPIITGNANISTVYGLFFQPTMNPNVTVANAYGVFSNLNHGIGTLTTGTAVYAKISESLGTTTTGIGVDVASANTFGTLTTMIGLRMTALAGATTTWGMQVGNYQSYHHGRMKFGAASAPATSAAVEIDSTTGALLLPRMTTTQKNALTAVNGMAVYDSTLNKVQVYEGGAWASVI